jgi:hypothetical protein
MLITTIFTRKHFTVNISQFKDEGHWERYVDVGIHKNPMFFQLVFLKLYNFFSKQKLAIAHCRTQTIV